MLGLVDAVKEFHRAVVQVRREQIEGNAISVRIVLRSLARTTGLLLASSSSKNDPIVTPSAWAIAINDLSEGLALLFSIWLIRLLVRLVFSATSRIVRALCLRILLTLLPISILSPHCS